jgi:hypothetical protein
MEKHSAKAFWDFARYIYNQFGMRIATLATYRDGEGEPAILLYA